MSNTKVYEIITEQVIKALDKGSIPWRKPWRSANISMPVSGNGYSYRGINPFLLTFVAQANGYTSPVWLTFKKASELGGKVNEGEKATPVVFWTTFMGKTRDKKTNEEVTKKIPMLRYYNVFNSEQTTGVKLPKKLQALVDAASDPDQGAIFNNEKAQAILDGYVTKPPIIHKNGAQASYSPTADKIMIARQQDFESEEGYWRTLGHELHHSTGHKDRLNRKGVVEAIHFGDEKYANEELVAEFGSAFFSMLAGINNNGESIDDHAAYIASWKKRMQDDPKLVVSAAAAAQKSMDYILGTKFEKTEE